MKGPGSQVHPVRALFGSRFGLRFAAFVGVACAATVAVAFVAGKQAAPAGSPEPLTAYVPQGSLLAIESPDFASLLSAWTNSAEEQAWVRSDNYAEFSRSRLFARLGEAQSEFAATAGLAPDAKFLAQVAGGESVFAWYDIGKLEFLYVTRMKPGEAAGNPLLKLAATPQGGFQMRRVGADSFYVKAKAEQTGEQGGQMESVEQGSTRTVGFAVHGDLLLLATREDLIANALLLMQHQGDSTLRNEPWYAAAVSGAGEGGAVAGKDAGRPDLRMTLNLARIVPSPYFRSYWVQRNVTSMKQYQAAVSDLYRTPGSFREERMLIPKSPDAATADADLGPVLRYLPADSGVYRATAQPGSAAVLDELNRRLLEREAASYRDLRVAPVADLAERSVGMAGDLDTRIDEQPVPEQPLAAALGRLRGAIEAARVDSMLVYSSARNTDEGGAGRVFSPVHSAVVSGRRRAMGCEGAPRRADRGAGSAVYGGGDRVGVAADGGGRRGLAQALRPTAAGDGGPWADAGARVGSTDVVGDVAGGGRERSRRQGRGANGRGLQPQRGTGRFAAADWAAGPHRRSGPGHERGRHGAGSAVFLEGHGELERELSGARFREVC